MKWWRFDVLVMGVVCKEGNGGRVWINTVYIPCLPSRDDHVLRGVQCGSTTVTLKMTIIHITSLSELNKTLSASSTKVSVRVDSVFCVNFDSFLVPGY